MSDASPYFDELNAIHVEIQAWYRGTAEARADSDALDRLMARFSPQFSMILPTGATLDWSTLREIFAKHGGQRPDFGIAIADMAIVAQHPSGAVVTYSERQTDGGLNLNLRRSTAVLEIDAHGTVLWRHLQETFCVD